MDGEAGSPKADDPRAQCLALLEDVRAGRVDPSSFAAQKLLMVGLLRGWIDRRAADEAADAYWDAQVDACVADVEAGRRDPTDPATAMLLDWGVSNGRITKKRRRDLDKAHKARSG